MFNGSLKEKVGFLSSETSSTQQLNIFFINVARSDIMLSLNHHKLHQNAEDTVMGELSFDRPTAEPTFKSPVHLFQVLVF